MGGVLPCVCVAFFLFTAFESLKTQGGTPVRPIQCSLDVLQYQSTVPSTWIPSANPPISITSLSQLVCPKFVNALLSLIASLLVYAPLYHLVGHRQSSFDHVTSSSSSSFSIIFLLFRVLVFSEFQQRSIASSSAIIVFPLHRLISPSSLTHHWLS